MTPRLSQARITSLSIPLFQVALKGFFLAGGGGGRGGGSLLVKKDMVEET